VNKRLNNIKIYIYREKIILVCVGYFQKRCPHGPVKSEITGNCNEWIIYEKTQ